MKTASRLQKIPPYIFNEIDSLKKTLKNPIDFGIGDPDLPTPDFIVDEAIRQMKKPKNEVYQRFVKAFEKKNRELGKKQYIIPYLISGHPGSSLNEAIELALYLKKQGFIPDQVQDFYPTPGTRSTTMYHCGFDPASGQKVYVAQGEREKKLQRALLQYNKTENIPLVREALEKAGRNDV